MNKPNQHGEKWTNELDNELKENFIGAATNQNFSNKITELADYFSRSEGSIIARLKKHELIAYDNTTRKYSIIQNNGGVIKSYEVDKIYEKQEVSKEIPKVMLMSELIINNISYTTINKNININYNDNNFLLQLSKLRAYLKKFDERYYLDCIISEDVTAFIKKFDEQNKKYINSIGSNYSSMLSEYNNNYSIKPTLKFNDNCPQFCIYDENKVQIKFSDFMKFKNYEIVPVISFDCLWNKENNYYCILSIKAFKVYKNNYIFDYCLFRE